MFLYRKLIDGNVFVSEAESGVFEYTATDSVLDPLLYDNISSITNWDAFGIKYIQKDYKWIRDKIKDFVENLGSGDIDTGFALCTLPEQLILVKHKIGSHALRVLAFKTYYMALGQNEATAQATAFTTNIQLGLQYQSWVTPIRNIRFAYAYGLIYNYLPNHAKLIFEQKPNGDPYTDQVWTPVHSVIFSYIGVGVEGKEIGDPMGIHDWFYGLNQFSGGNGFVDYPWTPENGLTMLQLADGAWNIIHNGNY